MNEALENLSEFFRNTYQQTKCGLLWGPARRMEFYNMAAGFMQDGMPVFDMIQVLEERWRDQRDGRHAYLAQMLSAMRGGRNGKALRVGEAIAAWAPSLEAMAIDGGEQVGDLAEGFRMASRLAETQTKIKKTVNGEMLYPGFLLMLFVIALIAIDKVVLPVFEGISPRYMWPTSARYMAALASNSIAITVGTISTVLLVLSIFFFTRGRWTGRAREVFDAWIPPWTIHRRITGAIMMSCFSNFIRAGIPFSAVIEKLSGTASEWEKFHLIAMRNKMRRGMRDGDAMAGPLFDEDIKWEISVYGRMTTFHEALVSLANRTTERTLDRIKNTSALMRFMAMFLVAGLVVWVYSSFFEITMVAKSAGGIR